MRVSRTDTCKDILEKLAQRDEVTADASSMKIFFSGRALAPSDVICDSGVEDGFVLVLIYIQVCRNILLRIPQHHTSDPGPALVRLSHTSTPTPVQKPPPSAAGVALPVVAPYRVAVVDDAEQVEPWQANADFMFGLFFGLLLGWLSVLFLCADRRIHRHFQIGILCGMMISIMMGFLQFYAMTTGDQPGSGGVPDPSAVPDVSPPPAVPDAPPPPAW